MRKTVLTRRGLLLALAGLLGLAILLPVAGSRPASAQPAANPPPSGPQPPVQPTPVPRGPYSAVGATGNPNVEYGFTMAEREHDARLANDGFQWTEFEVDWGHSETSRGVYDWGNVDNIVNAAAAAGVGVILRVDQSPGWANGTGSPGWYPPLNPVDYGNFVHALALHVRGRLARAPVYEVWNEPNISDNWGGNCPDPTAYTNLVKAAYPQMKSADRAARLLAGSVTTVGALPARQIPATCAVDDLAFLQGMYNAGILGSFDALSTHPYGFGDTPEADPRTPGRTLVYRRAELQREVMLQNGDAVHHIWLTESGWAINPHTVGNCTGTYPWYFIWNPQQQAAYLVRAFNWARAYWDWIDTIVIFNFDYNESFTQPCDQFNFFSVLDRPAETALINNRWNPPPTYTPLPTATPTPVDNPPVVSAARLDPSYYWHSGGPLTVQVDASDPDVSQVSAAYFQVTYPDSSTQIVAMSLASGTPANGTWQGVFQVPNPPGPDNQTYGIQACAVEDFPPRRVICAPSVAFLVSLTRFVDVPTSFWGYPAIEYLAAQGIISGYADHTFRPYNNATRAQFAKMIVAAEAWTIVTPANPTFSDVPPDNPYFGVVETAYAHGVISGYGDGTFRPYNNVTRAQIAKLIALGEAWMLAPPATPSFNDVPPGNPFYPFVEAVATRGVASGYADGTFRPYNNATRAQLSKMLYNAIGIRPSVTPMPTDTPTTVVTNTPAPFPSPSATATATAPRPTATRTAPPPASVTATRTSVPGATATVTATPAR